MSGISIRRLIIECKWSLDGDNLFELLDDLFKVTSANNEGFKVGYLLAGARLWEKPALCADCFVSDTGSTVRVVPASLLAEHCDLWEWIRAHGAGRPTRRRWRLR